MAGLFGPNAAQVQQQMQLEIANNARQFSGLTGGAVAGTLFGRAAQNLMGQADDPRLKKAQALQEVEQQMTQLGLEPGTPEFTQTLGQLMLAKVGPGEAAEAVAKAQAIEKQRADIATMQAALPNNKGQQNLYRLLKRLNYDDADAEALSLQPKIAGKLIEKGFTPEDLNTTQENYQAAVADGSFKGGLMDYIVSVANAKRPISSNTVHNYPSGGQNFQSPFGDVINDSLLVEQMPEDTPEQRERKENARLAFKRKIENQGRGLEQQRAMERMGAVSDLTDHFNDIADANPDVAGSVGGYKTRIRMANNVLGAFLRHVSPTKPGEGELTSISSQMKGLLGTALSGAAIPQSEWPIYEGQVPQPTDDPGLRAAKTATYRQMYRFLLERAGIKARIDAGETGLSLPDLPVSLRKKAASARTATAPVTTQDGWSIRIDR